MYHTLFLHPVDHDLIGTISPQTFFGHVRSQLKLTCYSLSVPIWMRNGKLLREHLAPHKRSFSKLAEVSDTGHYVCYGLNHLNQIFRSSANVYIACKEF